MSKERELIAFIRGAMLADKQLTEEQCTKKQIEDLYFRGCWSVIDKALTEYYKVRSTRSVSKPLYPSEAEGFKDVSNGWNCDKFKNIIKY